MTYDLGNEGRGTGDGEVVVVRKNGKSVRYRRTNKDIARKVATSGSMLPDPEVATFCAISLPVSRLPTPFLFLSYNHCTIAHAVANDLTTSSWNEVSNISLTLNSLLTAHAAQSVSFFENKFR